MINPRTNKRIKFSTKSDLTIFQNWPLTQRSSLSASAINWAPWSLIIGFLQMVIRRSPGILSRSGRRYRRLSCHATPWRLVAWCYVWIKQHSVVSWIHDSAWRRDSRLESSMETFESSYATFESLESSLETFETSIEWYESSFETFETSSKSNEQKFRDVRAEHWVVRVEFRDVWVEYRVVRVEFRDVRIEHRVVRVEFGDVRDKFRDVRVECRVARVEFRACIMPYEPWKIIAKLWLIEEK